MWQATTDAAVKVGNAGALGAIGGALCFKLAASGRSQILAVIGPAGLTLAGAHYLCRGYRIWKPASAATGHWNAPGHLPQRKSSRL